MSNTIDGKTSTQWQKISKAAKQPPSSNGQYIDNAFKPVAHKNPSQPVVGTPYTFSNPLVTKGPVNGAGAYKFANPFQGSNTGLDLPPEIGTATPAKSSGTGNFGSGLGKAVASGVLGKASSGGGGVGGGSGGGGISGDGSVAADVAEPDPFTIDTLLSKLQMNEYKPQPIIDLYTSLSNAILGNKATAATDLQNQVSATKQIYDDSTSRIAQMLGTQQQGLDQSAAGLGVNLQGSALQQQINDHNVLNASARDANRSADEIYWDKAKQGQADVYDMLKNSSDLASSNHQADLYNMINQSNAAITSDADQQFAQYQIALQQAAAAALSGGGGRGYSRRGGGGGSGSSKSLYDTTTASETQNLNNVGDEAIYESLLGSNPSAAAEYLRLSNLSSGNSLLANTQKEYDNAAAKYSTARSSLNSGNLYNLFNIPANAAKTASAAKKVLTLQDVLNAASLTGGVMGNPNVKSSVATKGSQKTTVQGVPYKTTAAPAAAPSKKSIGARLFK